MIQLAARRSDTHSLRVSSTITTSTTVPQNRTIMIRIWRFNHAGGKQNINIARWLD